MLQQDKGLLMNFRSNIINGNKKECREIMREYGESDFLFNYAGYLESIGFTEELIVEEMRQALANFKFIE